MPAARVAKSADTYPFPCLLSMRHSPGPLHTALQVVPHATLGRSVRVESADSCSSPWNGAVRQSWSLASPGRADNSLLSDYRANVLSWMLHLYDTFPCLLPHCLGAFQVPVTVFGVNAEHSLTPHRDRTFPKASSPSFLSDAMCHLLTIRTIWPLLLSFTRKKNSLHNFPIVAATNYYKFNGLK